MDSRSTTSNGPTPHQEAIPLTVERGPRAGARLDTSHRDLLDGTWWQRIPTWSDVDEATFLDHVWQAKHSVTDARKLVEEVGTLADDSFTKSLAAGLDAAPMQIRLSPYLLSLIDWTNAREDPIRRQFLPLDDEQEPDHPMARLDSLAEQDHAVVHGLIHRYPDKVLFLALDVCPVYCRYCTRSYSIGSDTETVDKVVHRPERKRWAEAIEYIRTNDSVEDVVVSGGDVYMLSPKHLREIVGGLLEIPHVRRIRLATKGLAVMPQKILSHPEWTNAVVELVETGRRRGVHVCIHTHFNHPNEITAISQRAMQVLFEAGVTVRNQAVLVRGVNDDPGTMTRFVKRLSWINVHPYYVYVHDMVPGVECLRTTVAAAQEVEKSVRGSTAGYQTPTFVCDVPGGGGKRNVHSMEHYDRDLGVVVYRAPAVDSKRHYLHFDPLSTLSDEAVARWNRPGEAERIVAETLSKLD